MLLSQARLQPLQYFALGIGAVHMLTVISYIFLVSPSRQGLGSHAENTSFAYEEIDQTAQVVMDTFNRTEFKEGNRHWTINAKTARYLSEKNTVLLDAPIVTIFKENNEPPTIVKAASARLTIEEGSVRNAFLEGNVNIILSPDLTMFTSVAEYREADGRLIAPERVFIEGSGYKVSGNRMDLSVEKAFVSLYEDIESSFEGGKKPALKGLRSTIKK
jgi:LPS export ABC transporter protein LptC